MRGVILNEHKSLDNYLRKKLCDEAGCFFIGLDVIDCVTNLGTFRCSLNQLFLESFLAEPAF